MSKGPKQGLRVLAAEEDEARVLLDSLDEAQRHEAVFEERSYGEITTSNADKVDPLKPLGIAAARGRPHYYRIQGPRFLIEYDCSQNDGNHIHTVWRDFSGDFGRDLLRQTTRWRGEVHTDISF